MIGGDKIKISTYVDRTLKDYLEVARMKYNRERWKNVSESKFVGVCLAEWVNQNRDKAGVVKVSDRDIDFE